MGGDGWCPILSVSASKAWNNYCTKGQSASVALFFLSFNFLYVKGKNDCRSVLYVALLASCKGGLQATMCPKKLSKADAHCRNQTLAAGTRSSPYCTTGWTQKENNRYSVQTDGRFLSLISWNAQFFVMNIGLATTSICSQRLKGELNPLMVTQSALWCRT